MPTAGNMDLEAAAWMVRSLGQSVSSLFQSQEGDLIAGGWDGRMRMWNSHGDVIWTIEAGDRVSDFSRQGDYLFATCGLHVTAFSYSDGEQLWSHALEGSADELTIHNGQVMVVSSVYDIEHNDFLESAVWCYSFTGELQWVSRMSERPWTIFSTKNDLIIGLGRPQCGMGVIGDEGSIEYKQLASESPVMCGVNGAAKQLFGHADGTISTAKGQLINKQESGIESLSCTSHGFVCTLDDGKIAAYDPDGKIMWSNEGHPVVEQTEGCIIGEENSHWTARWDGLKGYLEVRNSLTGEMLANMQSSQIRSMQGNSQTIAIGCDDGQVILWQSELLTRRVSEDLPAQQPSVDSRKSALQAKLRALRDK
jgi:WD40 repeat protein